MNNLDVGKWLNPLHINADQITDYKQKFLKTTPNRLILDNFLKPSVLSMLQGVFHFDQYFYQQYHTNAERYISQQRWDQIDDKSKFVDRWEFRPPHQPNPVLQLCSVFMQALSSLPFCEYFSSIINKPIGKMVDRPPPKLFKCLSNGFVRAHIDCSPGRVLCLNLYLTPDWNPSYGGELFMSGIEPGKPIKIPPLYNRCVLFDPCSAGSQHWIGAIRDEAPVRQNLTYWYFSGNAGHQA